MDALLKCDFLFVISCLFRSLFTDYFSSIVNNLRMCAVAKQPLMAKREVFMGERAGEGKIVCVTVCLLTFSAVILEDDRS